MVQYFQISLIEKKVVAVDDISFTFFANCSTNKLEVPCALGFASMNMPALISHDKI